MASPADLILYNASVITLDEQVRQAELVAIQGDRILAVGKTTDLDDLRGRKTRLINCEGKTVIPGFNDAHAHLLAFADSLLSADCSPALVSSIAEIQEVIRRCAEKIPPGNWIKATGYNEFYLAERHHPTRWDLDQAAPHHPVRLIHHTRHACVLNSLALSLAKIGKETPDPPGGVIERHPQTGEPTGLLLEMNDYLTRFILPLAEGELIQGVRLACQRYLSLGITSVQDATAHNDLARWHTLCQLREKGVLSLRVSMMVGIDAVDQFTYRGIGPGFGDEKLRLGAVKVILREAPGRLYPPQAELENQVLLAHQAGFQVAFHAVEEATVEVAIGAIQKAINQAQRINHRHRIEHCSVCPPNLLRRLKRVRAVIVTQPAFLYYSGQRYLAAVPSTQRPWLYRIGSWVKDGLMVAASSDCPIVSPNPMIGIYSAVTRRAQTGETLLPNEAVSPLQAIWMYTLGGAYASFEENIKGSVAPGKLADLAVLSADPTQVPAEDMKEIRVEKTILGGRVVWEASGEVSG